MRIQHRPILHRRILEKKPRSHNTLQDGIGWHEIAHLRVARTRRRQTRKKIQLLQSGCGRHFCFFFVWRKKSGEIFFFFFLSFLLLFFLFFFSSFFLCVKFGSRGWGDKEGCVCVCFAERGRYYRYGQLIERDEMLLKMGRIIFFCVL